MTQMRPPEAVLYAFSQWLQQWADYALSQAEQFSASTNSDEPAEGTQAADNPPVFQERQPPDHWLELVTPGPPAHWLALFEEYGLNPPEAGASPGDVQPGAQTPNSAPRLLQEWLGEFQRGLTQFVPFPPDQPLSEPGDIAPKVERPLRHRDALAEASPAVRTLLETVPEKPGAEDEADPEALSLPSSAKPPKAEYPTPVPDAQVRGLAADSALPYPSDEEGSMERVLVRPRGQKSVEEAQPDIPAARALTPDPHPESSGVERVGERPLPGSIPPVFAARTPDQEKDMQVAGPVEGTSGDIDQSTRGAGAKARSAPVRLRLNPEPQVSMTIPASPTFEGASTRPVLVGPSQVAPNIVPRLFVGGAVPTDKPRFGSPAPGVEPVSEPRQGEPAMQNTRKSEGGDVLTETDPDSLLTQIKWSEEADVPDSPLQVSRSQAPPQWSHPAAPHWPELPERLPAVRPPSNVLADPAHRQRINREQRGRSWNA